MRASKSDLPKTFEMDQITVREIEWGDMHLAIETYHQDLDNAPFLRGLPDDRCQCPHWGYVLKGRMVVSYGDREEVANVGDAYYIAPGHTVTMDADSEVVEFSPKEEYQKTMEAVERNIAALAPA